MLSHEQLVDLAAPPCQVCEQPVQRAEWLWHQDEDGRWRQRCALVCRDGHRTLVEPLP